MSNIVIHSATKTIVAFAVSKKDKELFLSSCADF